MTADMTIEPCDCLNDCGDDPRIRAGRVAPCAHRVKWLDRPMFIGVDVAVGNDCTVVARFSKPVTGDLLASLDTLIRRGT